MRMIQVELERLIDDKRTLTVCWLPLEDPRPKQGMLVSLIGDDRSIWKIARTFMTLNLENLNRGWKVGGLVGA